MIIKIQHRITDIPVSGELFFLAKKGMIKRKDRVLLDFFDNMSYYSFVMMSSIFMMYRRYMMIPPFSVVCFA